MKKIFVMKNKSNDNKLPDIIPEKETVLLIVGESVGPNSKEHYYAGDKNEFWNLLSLVIGKTLSPYQDREVVKYGIGLTDIIKDKVLLNGVEPGKIDDYFEAFKTRVKKDFNNPKIIVFNGMMGGNPIRNKLKRKIEKFIEEEGANYIIRHHYSSSGNLRPKYIEARKKQWEELAEIYKSLIEKS